MGNTNFQTIHQMGTAISDFVKQATGRDNVQNVVMDHVTVAQNHRYEEVDISGRVVSFQAGEAGLPFEKLDVQIKPVQDLHGYDHPWPAGGGSNIWDEEWAVGIIDGTGQYVSSGDRVVSKNYIPVTPGETYYTINVAWVYFYASDTVESKISNISPNPTFTVPSDAHFVKFYTGQPYGTVYKNDVAINYPATVTTYAPYSNICPITGWTMANVYQSGPNMEDARVYRFTFPSEAGIVYGGTLDVVSGELTVDRDEVDLGALDWATNASYGFNRFFTTIAEKANGQTNLICSALAVETDAVGANQHDNTVKGISSSNAIYVRCDSVADASSFKTAMSGVQLVYELATPLTYHLTPQEITTLLGQNYIWADTGEIEVKFTNVKEWY